QQREEPVAYALRQDEVADEPAVEARQPVEPLEARLRDELGEPVPGEHVAVGAGEIGGPEQDDARHPCEPAKPAQAVEREMARKVQAHREHHRVGSVTMRAAQDPAEAPPPVGDALHGGVGAVHARVEEHVERDAGYGDDPEQEEGDRAQMVERIEAIAERTVEQRLGAHASCAQAALPQLDHRDPAREDAGAGDLVARRTTTTNRRPPTIASNPPAPITPMPAISPALRSTCSLPATLRWTP